MKLAVTLAIAAGAAIAPLANTTTLATGLAAGLIVLAITAPIVIAIRADQRRNGIPTRFANHERATPIR